MNKLSIAEMANAIYDWCTDEDNDACSPIDNLVELLENCLDEETYNTVITTIYKDSGIESYKKEEN